MSVICLLLVDQMLSGCVVATSHSHEILGMRVYRIPNRDFLLDGGLYLPRRTLLPAVD
jgi:hypothetical protein